MAGGGLARLRRLDGESDSESELLEALSAPADSWRLVALQGLSRIGSPAAITAADGVLAEDRQADPFLLATARLILAEAGRGDPQDLIMRALGRRGRVEEGRWPVRPLVGRARGQGWPVRRLAVQALERLSTGRHACRRVLLEDPDWAVRLAAVSALEGEMSDEDRDALEDALDDPRQPIRQAAAALLERPDDDRALDPDGYYAWHVPGFEPYFRYLSGTARREYGDELDRGTRDGPGRNWGTFGVLCDLDIGDEPPEDLDPGWPALRPLGGVPTALTLGRDLLHHPAVVWGDEPGWPACCDDFAIFYGHNLAAVSPRSQDREQWFLDSLLPGLPRPAVPLEELEADAYAFRCGYCGSWLVTYEPIM